MATVVTGLAQSSDTTSLRAALTGAGLSLEHMQVISGDDAVEPIARGVIGAELLTGDPGTTVPGITGELGGSPRFFRSESLDERLSELQIPDSEVENYAEALERGKTLVAYFAKPENVEKVKAAFHEAALVNVRTF